ncbi:MAG: arginine--tRNA ligase [Candidatus Pacearchaeota archaeon]
MKEVISKVLKKYIKNLSEEEIEKIIETPPSEELGDCAFPCFSLAKIEKKNPLLIAESIYEKIKKDLPKEIQKVELRSAYINFFINPIFLAEKVLKEKEKKYKENKSVVIDFSSPNIAKPFGIGHLRSTIIGNSLANIFEHFGWKVIKINYLGDWGTQFGKLIFGFKKWGKKEELKKDPINHLLEIYVKANKKEYEEEGRKEFKKLEEYEEENLRLWEEFRKLSLKKFDEIYDFLGIKFDEISGESFYNKKAKDFVKFLEEKNILKESEGAKIVDLEKFNLGIVIIEKKDGALPYITRDLAASLDRFQKYRFDKMIYEVGQEQKLHFRQLFKILELCGFEFHNKCIHVSHGLYLDEEGKKFSTREGKTIFMEDIIKKTKELAKEKILKRETNLNQKELEKRALLVARAAIIYGDLKNYREKDVVFDIQKFLDFEGNTGPYLLYSYARASSIIRKFKGNKKFKLIDINKEEEKLIKKIYQFENITKNSLKNLSPNLIANYAFELCQIFNEFYHMHQVIGSREESYRIALVDSFRRTLKKSLNLLGIKEIEEM